MSLLLRFDIRHYLGRPFSSFLDSYHLWYMSTCYMCLSSHRKSIYATRNAMPRKTCQLRLSQKIMKFYVLTRFRETIPTVQSVELNKYFFFEKILFYNERCSFGDSGKKTSQNRSKIKSSARAPNWPSKHTRRAQARALPANAAHAACPCCASPARLRPGPSPPSA